MLMYPSVLTPVEISSVENDIQIKENKFGNILNERLIHENGIIIEPQSSSKPNDIIIHAPPGPSVIGSSNITYEIGSINNEISWTIDAKQNFNYEIFNNSISQVNVTNLDKSITSITYNVDGLSIGIYNFTLISWKTSGSDPSIPASIFVTVTQDNPPTIQALVNLVPSNLVVYEVGDTGYEIQWNITDGSPANYSIFNNSVEIDNGNWVSGVLVNVSVDGLGLGYYNFTIFANDTSGNSQTNYVNVTVANIITPSISSPIDFSYEEGSTGNFINWTATDNSPDKLMIFRNTTSIVNNTWVSNGIISTNIDGYSLGVYNYTIYLNDTDGNEIIDTVFVTVVDTTPPNINNPPDIPFAEGQSGFFILWNASDTHNFTYYVYLENIPLTNANWTSNEWINITIGETTFGNYNYTISVYDESLNSAVDTVIVDIFDPNQPIVLGLTSKTTFEQEDANNELTWNLKDDNPDYYRILRNGTQVQTNLWQSNDNVTINIMDLVIGTYNYTIIATDLSNNNATMTLIISVVDTTLPILVSSPDDISYYVNSTGNTLVWDFTDLNPDIYKIYVNSSFNFQNPWSNSVSISISVDNKDPGVYIYEIHVLDTSGNTHIDTVTVTVLSLQQTLQPLFSSDLFASVHEGDVDTITGIWETVSNEVVLNGTINLF